MTADWSDPKGLIRESYRIDGISDAECRSILIDWALSLGMDIDRNAALDALLQGYGAQHPAQHPMSILLRAARDDAPVPKRRGGRAGRLGYERS